MIDFDYPRLLDLFPHFMVKGRNESASFLMWYLENYYRLDKQEAVESVCDKSNDKGIDGIYVNDNDKTITIFQSRISQDATSTIGDKSLREFAGTLTQFVNQESIQNLIDTANEKVVSLLKRIEIMNKILNHEIRGEFISNVDIDQNGENFLKTAGNIAFIGKTMLANTYISERRDAPIHGSISFDIGGFRVAEYTVDTKTKAIIAPIKATELVKMEGISNQSLFYFNVRGPLGKTAVNKEIQESIQKGERHKLFPLFHNGITVVAGNLDITTDAIIINDYFVVNGCQSLSALYSNKKHLTDDLRVLVKIIHLEPTSDLAKMVTEFSNNQNGVRGRDFKSNDKIQIRLQNEFKKNYKDQYFFEIKRGELPDKGTVISNEEAGLLLMSFDSKIPWATHRKYQVFEDMHASLFARREVTADRIVFIWEIAESVEMGLSQFKNPLLASYTLTRYVLVYIIRNILENDDLSKSMFENPESFVRNSDIRKKFSACIDRIISDVITDINAELGELNEDFDYRDKLRDEAWVKSLNKAIVSTRDKLIRRGNIKTFKEDWNNIFSTSSKK